MLVGTTINDVERCTGRQTVAASEFSSFDQTIQVGDNRIGLGAGMAQKILCTNLV